MSVVLNLFDPILDFLQEAGNCFGLDYHLKLKKINKLSKSLYAS